MSHFKGSGSSVHPSSITSSIVPTDAVSYTHLLYPFLEFAPGVGVEQAAFAHGVICLLYTSLYLHFQHVVLGFESVFMGAFHVFHQFREHGTVFVGHFLHPVSYTHLDVYKRQV